ncbi:signal peptidase I [Catenulispora sp. MAP5-51]|uniref:S24/S26 family peptidase n=1 Tax=Catenulispora sp. MAP5-51 TaxID=3156298 RepID=UPI003510D8EB
MAVALVTGLAAVLILAVMAAGVVLKARRHVVVTVEGTSMAPTYRPGDRLLVRRCALAGVQRGQAVVVLRPDLVTGWKVAGRAGGMPGDSPWFVKRATALPGDPTPDGAVPPDHLYLLGDNPASEDSRRWGWCPGERLVGVVVRELGR